VAQGDHKGSLTASVASVTNPTNLTGSVSVALSDLIFVCFSQQTALTATTVTDNLGNTYTAVNAGTDAGTATIRCYFSRVTAAGTLTQISVAATASANDASAVGSVIEGPFVASPLDANPANTTDGTTPFDCPPTGTLAQTNEVVMAAIAVASAQTVAATSPDVITQTVNRANISTGVSRRVVSSTSTVTPQFTGTSAVAAQTTASFKLDVVVVSAPAGRQRTDRPEPGPVFAPHFRAWSVNLLQSTLKPAPVLPTIFRAPVYAVRIGKAYRSYGWIHQPVLQTSLAPIIEFVPRTPYYAARVRIAHRDFTWIQSPVPKLFFPVRIVGIGIPERREWYRNWTLSLQQFVPVVFKPFAQDHWPLTPARPFNVALRTITARYNLNLIGQDRLPIGESVTDRPSVPSFYRSYIVNLLQSTLTPAEVRPFVQDDWPLTPAHPFSVTLRTLTVRFSSSLIGQLPIGRILTEQPPLRIFWQRDWAVNLVLTTLQGQDQMLVGDQVTDRPPVPPWYRDWRVNLLLSTLTLETPRPIKQTDWPLARGPRYPIDLRTIAESYNVNLVGQDRLPTGDRHTSRPPVPPWYRDWRVNLLQSTLTPQVFDAFRQTDWPVPRGHPFGSDLRTWTRFYNINLIGRDIVPGRSVTDLPPREHQRSIQLRTWTEKYNPNLIGRDVVPGEIYFDRPPVPPFYRSWIDVRTHLLPTGFKPFLQTHWPLTPARHFANDLRTWAAKYNPNLIGKDILPVGENLTARPPVPPFYRDWSVNLLQTTLRAVPVGKIISELVPFGPRQPVQIRTLTEKYNPNLIGKDRLPSGDIYYDRPPVPPWYRAWLLNLLQSTLAPPPLELDELPRNQYFWPLTGRAYYALRDGFEEIRFFGTDIIPPVPRTDRGTREVPLDAQGQRPPVEDQHRPQPEFHRTAPWSGRGSGPRRQ
jgi:hypothetical protein